MLTHTHTNSRTYTLSFFNLIFILFSRLYPQSLRFNNYKFLFVLLQIFRHGDRTPDNNGREMFPNDPYINYSFYPIGLGQLTTVSMT